MKVDYDSGSARNYDDLWGFPESLYQPVLKSVLRKLKMGQPVRILDVGCGPGSHTLFLDSLFDGETIGLDMSIEMLKLVQKETSKVELLQASGEVIPLANGVIDLAFMSYVLHQVKEKEELVSEVYRVLKSDAHIAMLTSSQEQLKKDPLHQYFPGLLQKNLRRFPTLAKIKEMLTKVGFKNIDLSTISAERQISADEMIQLARQKCMSVLKLLSEEEFQDGLGIFEKRLKSKYNDKFLYEDSSSLIIADKLA